MFCEHLCFGQLAGGTQPSSSGLSPTAGHRFQLTPRGAVLISKFGVTHLGNEHFMCCVQEALNSFLIMCCQMCGDDHSAVTLNVVLSMLNFSYCVSQFGVLSAAAFFLCIHSAAPPLVFPFGEGLTFSRKTLSPMHSTLVCLHSPGTSEFSLWL